MTKRHHSSEFKEGLSRETYVDKILMPHVFPFIVRHPATVFMHDNAPPHRTRAATQSLIDADVTVLKWPAVSPDLNPIEHIWGFRKQELWKRPRASNSNELFQILEDIWGEIDPNFIKSLINSMKNRITTLLAANGGHTKY